MLLFPKAAFLSAALILGAVSASATTVTLQDPGVNYVDPTTFGATSYSVEDFDSYSTGSFRNASNTTGMTYDTGNIGKNTKFGADQSQYLTSATSGTTLTFDTPQTYFGFWWTAGSVGNTVELVSGGVTIFSFDINDVLDYLDALPNGDDYIDNPDGPSANGSQPYVFINFFADQAFDSVVLSGVNFESDNHTIAETYTTITGTDISAVPLPGTLPLLAGALIGAGWYTRRRRS